MDDRRDILLAAHQSLDPKVMSRMPVPWALSSSSTSRPKELKDRISASSPARGSSFSFILRGMAGGSTRSLSAALIFSVEDLPH